MKTALRWLLRVPKSFFEVKARKYEAAAHFLTANYPDGSLGRSKGELLQAWADLFASIAEALPPDDKDIERTDDYVMIRFYCACCGEYRPVVIEPLVKDMFNEEPWGDILCQECRFVASLAGEPLSMDLVVEAYRLYARTSTMQPYDGDLNYKAYRLWRRLHEKLAEREGVGVADLPMPPEAFRPVRIVPSPRGRS